MCRIWKVYPEKSVLQDWLKMISQNLLLILEDSEILERVVQQDVMLVLQESLSTYLSIKPIKTSLHISQHFSMLFLLSEGQFLGFFTQAKSLRTRLQFWKMVALETKWFLMVTHLILQLNSFVVSMCLFFFTCFLLPCWPNEHFGLQWSCLNFANSSIALV